MATLNEELNEMFKQAMHGMAIAAHIGKAAEIPKEEISRGVDMMINGLIEDMTEKVITNYEKAKQKVPQL